MKKVYLLRALPLSIFFIMTACGGGSGTNGGTGDDTAESSINLSNFQAADVVIGQADFTGTSPNQGGVVDANTFSTPYSTTVHNDVFYAGDFNNHRILGFNSLPTVNNTPADFVLGQVDFTSNVAGTSVSTLKTPVSLAVNGGKMFLSDFQNHRVLMWDTVPTSGNTTPDRVLGQPDLNTAVSGCSNTSLYGPAAIWSVGTKLIVSENSNNRVLIWNTLPTSNQQPADIVLGQQNFDNCRGNDSDGDGITDTPNASTLYIPTGVWSDGLRLVVVDSANHRVLIWNTFPTTSSIAADVVLGQSDFSHNKPNDDDQDNTTDVSGLATARTLSNPILGVYSNGIQLFVADSKNNRILVWNSFPTMSFTPADGVLGQNDFKQNKRNDDNQDDTSETTATARTLFGPTGIIQYEGKLIVTDTNNHRNLIYSGQ